MTGCVPRVSTTDSGVLSVATVSNEMFDGTLERSEAFRRVNDFSHQLNSGARDAFNVREKTGL
jgi:hypothetical protein